MNAPKFAPRVVAFGAVVPRRELREPPTQVRALALAVARERAVVRPSHRGFQRRAKHGGKKARGVPEADQGIGNRVFFFPLSVVFPGFGPSGFVAPPAVLAALLGAFSRRRPPRGTGRARDGVVPIAAQQPLDERVHGDVGRGAAQDAAPAPSLLEHVLHHRGGLSRAGRAVDQRDVLRFERARDGIALRPVQIAVDRLERRDRSGSLRGGLVGKRLFSILSRRRRPRAREPRRGRSEQNLHQPRSRKTREVYPRATLAGLPDVAHGVHQTFVARLVREAFQSQGSVQRVRRFVERDFQLRVPHPVHDAGAQRVASWFALVRANRDDVVRSELVRRQRRRAFSFSAAVRGCLTLTDGGRAARRELERDDCFPVKPAADVDALEPEERAAPLLRGLGAHSPQDGLALLLLSLALELEELERAPNERRDVHGGGGGGRGRRRERRGDGGFSDASRCGIPAVASRRGRGERAPRRLGRDAQVLGEERAQGLVVRDVLGEDLDDSRAGAQRYVPPFPVPGGRVRDAVRLRDGVQDGALARRHRGREPQGHFRRRRGRERRAVLRHRAGREAAAPRAPRSVERGCRREDVRSQVFES